MRTNISMVAILAAFLLGTAGLGYAQALPVVGAIVARLALAALKWAAEAPRGPHSGAATVASIPSLQRVNRALA
jgi:hypothetical protein